MDFQAVINAILNKGNVESQLADLVKDRDVHINPTVGTSGSTNTTLNNQIKRQANAQAKSYVQYSKSAIQKQMKHASGTFYTSGETSIDKGLVKRAKDQAKEMANVTKQIAKEEDVSTDTAYQYANKALKEQEKARNKALKDQAQADKKYQAEQKKLNEKAAKIESDIQAKRFASKSGKYQKQFSGYVDNNSKEYNAFGSDVLDYEKQRKEVNRMYGNFKKNRTTENRDFLIDAYAKLEQYDKNATNSLSLLNSSPNKVLKSDVDKQIKKIQKDQKENKKKKQSQQQLLENQVSEIVSNIQTKKFASKSSKYQQQLSQYVDNGSKEYSDFANSLRNYDKQRNELNKAFSNLQENHTFENKNALVEAYQKLDQYDKLASNNLSLLKTSPNSILTSDVKKQQEKHYKEHEKQYSNQLNQALKEQEQKDSYVQNVSKNLGNKSYDANLAAQQKKLSEYYSGSEEYKNANKSFEEYKKNVKGLQELHTQYQANPSTANQDAIIKQNEKVIQSYEKLNNEMKILDATQSKALNPGEGNIQANKIRTYMENNTKAAKEYGTALENLAKQSENATTKGEAQSINQQFKQMQSEISAKGLTGNSTFSEVKRGFSQISQFVGTYGILQSGMNKAQEMVQNTYDVDSAMTQLQMATGVSNDKAKDLMKTYSDMGHQLKATGTDVAASSTEWMKQGQSVEKSNKLAESSIKLSKVSGLSSEDATKYLTSARKGYGVTSAEDTLKIVDKLSSVDMASATDVGGLAEGMSEVANTAKIAGISMDKLLGYLATIGEVTQEGMGSVGTGLNAVFARMGNIKLSRLKDYQNNGEDLSNVETVLRGEGINLRDKTDQFRNFGDVLDEVAGNWNNYSDVSQRAIAQSFAGTHHMNEFITLMTNYGKAQEYEKVSENSAGSTDKKYKVYEDSLEGRTEDLKNSFQSISTTFADKNILGGGITLLSNVLNVVNKLVSSFGLLKTAVAGFAGIKLFKNLG
jgi:TP901 family phage tail tape measure protein